MDRTIELTHSPRTSSRRDASSGVNVQSVPFSACSRSNSLRLRFPAGVVGSPFVRTTEFRGVCWDIFPLALSFPLDVCDTWMSVSDRSQSSCCEPDADECRESCDMEKSTLVSAVVVMARRDFVWVGCVWLRASTVAVDGYSGRDFAEVEASKVDECMASSPRGMVTERNKGEWESL
jgi:hypothetical protein